VEFCRKKKTKEMAVDGDVPPETHRCVGKETGETAHMERWNTTLWQRVGRYVRQTLSFSKADISHYLITQWFIIQYNLNLSLTT